MKLTVFGSKVLMRLPYENARGLFLQNLSQIRGERNAARHLFGCVCSGQAFSDLSRWKFQRRRSFIPPDWRALIFRMGSCALTSRFQDRSSRIGASGSELRDQGVHDASNLKQKCTYRMFSKAIEVPSTFLSRKAGKCLQILGKYC